MRNWFRDGVMRSILKNAGYLASTKAVGGIIGLLALVCAGRGMSAVGFGTVMLIHTYALGIAAFTKFQSWQMIVRYAAPAMAREDRTTARQAIRFACGLDVTSGLFGMVLAMASVMLFGPRFGISPDIVPLAVAYCTLIPTMSSSTPAGILRVMDRFDLISLQQTATPAIRAVGALIGWLCGFGMPFFLLTWYIADLGGDLILWGMSLSELRRRNMMDAFRPSLLAAPRTLPESWHFVWSTNLTTSLDSCKEPVSNIILGHMLGPAAVGLYRIATSILSSAVKPALLMEKGFYPEIMRLDPASTRPWLLGLRSGLLAAATALAMVIGIWVLARPVTVLFGEKYHVAATLLMIMAPSIIMSMGGFPIPSLLFMAGRPKALFWSHVVGTSVWFVVLIWFTHRFGLYGAAAAYIVAPVLLFLCALIPTLYSFFNRHTLSLPTAEVAEEEALAAEAVTTGSET
ncbi:lipopolysaccharide biosynthesis protein [Acetobacter sp.]|uniref:lipopolysaccharide biosynthesis protein n=1 Tax=Acetobacter sp. TaxID=440 RepID=UPI0039E8C52E